MCFETENYIIFSSFTIKFFSIYLKDIKSESDFVDENDDDDVVIVTPLDECITHKPTESKYDTLTGLIPYEPKVNFTLD